MKLFIIEDEVPIRQELTQFLEKYGFQCESSDEFHGIAQLALASGADLILLDIRMVPKDGFETLREIRAMEDRADIPVIMLTGMEDRQSVMEGINLGICDYILKPFTPDDLLERIQRALNPDKQNRIYY